VLLSDFHCKKMVGSVSYPYTQDMLDSTNSDHDFANSIITGDESWVYGYGVEPIIFLKMKIHKNTKH
jgi:hypothetical protein